MKAISLPLFTLWWISQLDMRGPTPQPTAMADPTATLQPMALPTVSVGSVVTMSLQRAGLSAPSTSDVVNRAYR